MSDFLDPITPNSDGSVTYLTESQKAENRKKFLALPGVSDKINKMSENLEVSVDEILYAMEKETAGSYSSKQKNLGGGQALGLIQFLGTDRDEGKGGKTINKKFYKYEDLESMSTLDQLDVVSGYFKQNFKRKGGKPGQLYLSISAPAYVGKKGDEVVYAAGSDAAKKNSGWQTSDGSVTVDSLANFGGKAEFFTYMTGGQKAAAEKLTTIDELKSEHESYKNAMRKHEFANGELEEFENEIDNFTAKFYLDSESGKYGDISYEDRSRLYNKLFDEKILGLGSVKDSWKEPYFEEIQAKYAKENPDKPPLSQKRLEQKLKLHPTARRPKFGAQTYTGGINIDDLSPEELGSLQAKRSHFAKYAKGEDFAEKIHKKATGKSAPFIDTTTTQMFESLEYHPDWRSGGSGSYMQNYNPAKKKIYDYNQKAENKNTKIPLKGQHMQGEIDESAYDATILNVIDENNASSLIDFNQTPSEAAANIILQNEFNESFKPKFKPSEADGSKEYEESLQKEKEQEADESSVFDSEGNMYDANNLPAFLDNSNLLSKEDYDNYTGWQGDNPDGTFEEWNQLPAAKETEKDTETTETTDDTYFDLRGEGGIGEESFLDKVGGLSSLIGLATGAIGLGQALKDVDIPKDPKLGPAFQQRLEESKRMAQQGLTPSELAKAHNELDSSYATGIENIVRGSAGNRAQFMAGLGGLDVARQSALMDISVADAKMQRENQEKYDGMMLMDEQYSAARQAKYQNAKFEQDSARQSAGAALGGAGISMVSNAINDRQINRFRKIQSQKMLMQMGYKPNKNNNSGQDKIGETDEGEEVQTSFTLPSNFSQSNLLDSDDTSARQKAVTKTSLNSISPNLTSLPPTSGLINTSQSMMKDYMNRQNDIELDERRINSGYYLQKGVLSGELIDTDVEEEEV